MYESISQSIKKMKILKYKKKWVPESKSTNGLNMDTISYFRIGGKSMCRLNTVTLNKSIGIHIRIHLWKKNLYISDYKKKKWVAAKK